MAEICISVNEPLEDVIPYIRQGVGGVNWRLATAALKRELTSAGDSLVADLHPVIDSDGSARICPENVINSETGRKLGSQIASKGLAAMAERAVVNIITDLKSHPQR